MCLFALVVFSKSARGSISLETLSVSGYELNSVCQLYICWLTMDSKASIDFRVPVFVLLTRSGGHDVSCILHISKSFRLQNTESPAYLRICLNFKPTIAQVTFTPKGENWGREVCANLLLLRVITHSHTDMIIACATFISQVSRSYADRCR